MILNLLPDRAGLIDGELLPGDVLDVTLNKSSRVRKEARGETFRVTFHRVGVVDATHGDDIPLEEALVSKDHDAGWVLEGRVGGEDGVLQGFHHWSIAKVQRA